VFRTKAQREADEAAVAAAAGAGAGAGADDDDDDDGAALAARRAESRRLVADIVAREDAAGDGALALAKALRRRA
jgi:hypothetical protein